MQPRGVNDLIGRRLNRRIDRCNFVAFDEYRKRNYRAAVDEAVKANAIDLFWTHWLLAAAYGQLGETDAARKALDELLARKGDFAESGRHFMERWFESTLVDHFAVAA